MIVKNPKVDTNKIKIAGVQVYGNNNLAVMYYKGLYLIYNMQDRNVGCKLVEAESSKYKSMFMRDIIVCLRELGSTEDDMCIASEIAEQLSHRANEVIEDKEIYLESRGGCI